MNFVFTSCSSSSRKHNAQSVYSREDAHSTREADEKSRERESEYPPREEIGGNCYPNTMEGTANAKADDRERGPRLSLACCTTWTSARNNTNHYTVTAARRSRARSVI